MSARRLLTCLAALAVCCLVAPTTFAEDPPAAPQLRIDAGAHTAPISRIATDRAGRWLVTASSDKTARVWDLTDGQLLSTLRPPIGAGNEGKIHAVALSPDGGTVALAGWTGHEWDGSIAIYIMDRVSGRLLQRLTGLDNVVYDLSFSPDGRRIAASLAGRSGVRVFTLPEGRLLGEDRDYGGITSAIEFSPDGGRILSTSVDGFLRIHDVVPAGLALRAK
jgi:WD40 repeat protein